MDYILILKFKDKPECNRCMLCRTKGQNLEGETVIGCAALSRMSKCPEEGCRNDCPLKQVGE
jgi:hypothetical protein